jgi:hypothetical protein
MDKLSERLSIHAQDCARASLPDNDLVIDSHQMADLAEALREAAQLARRVEEAPVGHVDQAVAADAVVVDELDLSDWRLRGQRVRLVRED